MLSPKARKGLVPAVLALAACAALPAAASAKPQSRGNDLGVQVVRFAKGTSPAAMKQAVADAGAEVVTDLSAIDALAVVPKARGFTSTIKGEKGVKAAWLDLVNKASAFHARPAARPRLLQRRERARGAAVGGRPRRRPPGLEHDAAAPASRSP